MTIKSSIDLTHIYLGFRFDYKKRIDRFGVFELGNLSNEIVDCKKFDNFSKDPEIEMRNIYLPPPWVDKLNEAQEELTKSKEILSHLQKTHQKRLICILDDSNVKALENEIDLLTESICNSFKHIEVLVNDISHNDFKKDNRAIKDISKFNCHYILRKNAEASIVTQLKPLIQQFKLMQKNYISEVQKNSEVRIQNFTNKPESIDKYILHDQMLSDYENQNIQEMAKITRSVAELHSIFKEMSSLVIEQGSLVDRIDYNIENSLYEIQNAQRQIFKTEKSFKNKVFSKIIYFLLICIAIEIIIIITKIVF